ncbi:hypothetical protein NK6_9028 [Bradyrhizobium diazoefficiens]|uniref:Uncharacterized protein n=1 Tax=Bradyrhizobium diazoefficiens TaxID=1355477 RepID=A0A0E4BVQ3_9BRAD|nr:hypothetical protein NK6_9028 [Bradyrhizobium diazoefficiens]
MPHEFPNFSADRPRQDPADASVMASKWVSNAAENSRPVA